MWFFLAVLLALPIAIYLFLQAFGQNKFNIPIFYETGLTSTMDQCQGNYNLPYLVSYLIDMDSSLVAHESGKTVIYDLSDATATDYRIVMNNLQSLFARYGDDSRLLILSLTRDSEASQNKSLTKNHLVHILNHKKFLQFGRCILQLDLKYDSLHNQFNGKKMVLVDRFRRIRGYYDASVLQEIDRLNTEINILFNNQNEK